MPGAALKPQKRVLGDSTKAHRNASNLPSPSAAKRRKLDVGHPPGKLNVGHNSVNGKLGSSQPKSQFEEEFLEKLTQDISELKHKNFEKDQQWDRPSLEDFDENNDSLCFQQIEVEEGTLNGGRATVKLFGVTEASAPLSHREKLCSNFVISLATRFSCMSLTSFTIYTLQLLYPFKKPTVRATSRSSRLGLRCTSPLYSRFKWYFAKTFLDSKGIRKAHISRSQSQIQSLSTDCDHFSRANQTQITRVYGKGWMVGS